FRPLKSDWAFNPQRYNLAHMAVWIAVFSAMLGTGFLAKGKDHPGGSIAFWEKSCQEGRWNACKTWVHTLTVTCQFNYGSSCLAAGDALSEGAVVSRDAAQASTSYARACTMGLADGCANLRALTRRDGKKALQESCDGGNGESCFTLASTLSGGAGL